MDKPAGMSDERYELLCEIRETVEATLRILHNKDFDDSMHLSVIYSLLSTTLIDFYARGLIKKEAINRMTFECLAVVHQETAGGVE
jgi:hypothetical protein